MQSFVYDNFPSEISNVHFALITNVDNASQIRSRIISAATEAGPEGDKERAAVNFAFVEATLVSARADVCESVNT